jgi:hypothetical protein
MTKKQAKKPAKATRKAASKPTAARDEGKALSDEELEEVSGGAASPWQVKLSDQAWNIWEQTLGGPDTLWKIK